MPPTISRSKPFNLMRWFAVLSFICIALASAVTAIFLSRFLTDNLLQRDAFLTMELVNTTLRTERASFYFGAADPDYAKRHPEGVPNQPDFVEKILKFENAAPFFKGRTRAQANAEIEDFFHHIAEMPDVIRVHVYLRDRTIVWSSDPRVIGKRSDANAELNEAFAGKLKVDLEVSGQTGKEEHAFFEKKGIRFVENYIPVWLDDRSGVWGVVELYRTPHALLDAIRKGHLLVWGSAVGGGVFLYLTLFWIVRRANTLIQRQQAQLVETQTLAAVGEMASAVAHGLRNPLAAIRSSAELALEDDPVPSVKEPLSDIVAQADRLDRWVRDLLTSALPTVGEFAPVRIADVASRSAEAFTTQAERRGIEITVDLDPDLPTVDGNDAALAQALNGVVANAIEAMPDGGRLTVKAARAPSGGAVDLIVTDTGRGMSASQLHEVFQPFVTTKASGLGLGMPLAKRIIERHGGTVTLSSRAGEGTVVTMHIPAAG